MTGVELGAESSAGDVGNSAGGPTHGVKVDGASECLGVLRETTRDGVEDRFGTDRRGRVGEQRGNRVTCLMCKRKHES